MTKEEATQIMSTWLVSSKGAKGQRGYIEGWFDEEDAEAFRMAIEALQRQTDGDLISRADALQCKPEFLNPNPNDKPNNYPIGWNDAIKVWYADIKSLPSADAVQGKWITCHDVDKDTDVYECNKCRFVNWFPSTFCPDCGAKMERRPKCY